jgi:superfamily I DNA/RNA helicase
MSFHSLTLKQQEAIVSESKRLLVLAGAGSGKTSVLIEKILHLIVERRVKPSQILAITFSKSAPGK